MPYSFPFWYPNSNLGWNFTYGVKNQFLDSKMKWPFQFLNSKSLTHETHKVFSHTHVKGKSTCVPNYSNHHSRGLEQTDSALTLHSLYKKEKGRLAFTHVFSSCSVETFPLKKHHYPLFVHALLQSIFFSALLNSLFSYNVVVACSSFSFSFLFPLK